MCIVGRKQQDEGWWRAAFDIRITEFAHLFFRIKIEGRNLRGKYDVIVISARRRLGNFSSEWNTGDWNSAAV